jgi:hypothetical protein
LGRASALADRSGRGQPRPQHVGLASMLARHVQPCLPVASQRSWRSAAPWHRGLDRRVRLQALRPPKSDAPPRARGPVDHPWECGWPRPEGSHPLALRDDFSRSSRRSGGSEPGRRNVWAVCSREGAPVPGAPTDLQPLPSRAPSPPHRAFGRTTNARLRVGVDGGWGWPDGVGVSTPG